MKTAAFPSFLMPMQPRRAKPFHCNGWVYDGWRILAVKRGGVVRLWSRTGRDHARRFPEIARAVAALPGRELVVDGEVAVFDIPLVSRFEYLTVPPPPDVVITPPVYIAFDVLLVHGRDLRAKPLCDRRRALETLVDGSEVLPVRRLPNDLKAWEIVQARGYEGLVAKDDAAPYHPGPTMRWRKVKMPVPEHRRGGWRTSVGS